MSEESISNSDQVELKHARAIVLDPATDKIVNVIIVEVDAAGKTTFELDNFDLIIVPDDSSVGIDWSYNNGEFSPPTENPPEE